MLNSIRELREQARAEAEALDQERQAGHVRGPLHGIPMLLKDNIGTADTPTTAGSIALEGVIPEHDAVVTQRLRDAGAVILGKANLSEFAGWVDLDMPPGYSSLAGQVLNAYDLAASPGGSSAGSGTATSMAFATAAIGTETSGSILNPVAGREPRRREDHARPDQHRGHPAARAQLRRARPDGALGHRRRDAS